MKVFVIPSWHPTPTRPLWCTWVLPHISLLRSAGVQAYVLQMGLDDEPIPRGTDPWRQPVRLLKDQHLYVPVPRPKYRYQRSRFFYGRWLSKYRERLRKLYRLAVQSWGKPDLLHAHVSIPGGYLAAELGREIGVPVIVQEHYSGFESDARFFWRVGHFVRQMGASIQGFYVVSPAYQRIVERTNLLEVTGVLPNPVDTDLFAPQDAPVRRPSRFNIVSAGDLGVRKGTDVLLEALHRLPSRLDWEVTIFGDTSRRNEFAQWLEDPALAGRVQLPGKVPQIELARAYSASDLYVVSSRIETANVSMLEAMACGTPVVTTACGGPETLIDESVGIVVPPNDPDALSGGIQEMMRGSDRFGRDHLRAYVVERYSRAAVSSKVMDAYRRALQIHRPNNGNPGVRLAENEQTSGGSGRGRALK